MTKVRIGTRASKLALYQANLVKQTLAASGIDCEIVEIHSEGDLDTTSPLHKMGSVGVFIKALDDALLNNEIDIAVHSCKDLPTNPDEGLKIYAYLERGPFYDVLIHNGDSSFLDNNGPATIGTGSLRRRAQWKKRFENHSFEQLRGNIATRLGKLEKSDWQGIILAEASLKRLNYSMKNTIPLTWMIPAPAQGVIAIVGRSDDSNVGIIWIQGFLIIL